MAMTAAERSARRRAEHPERERAYQSQWRAAHPDRVAKYNRTYCMAHPERVAARRFEPYGITPAEYEAMVVAQGGKCAICRRTERASDRHTGSRLPLSIDHDHLTGSVRGLLCTACNKALGQFEEDPALLAAAIAYLAAA